MIPFSLWLLIAPFLFALLLGLLLLGAVALGGFLVFRTKKEAHERLFARGPAKGEAFVIDPFEDGQPAERRGRAFAPEAPADDPVPSILDEQTKRFLEQYQMEKAMMAERAKKEQVA